MPLFERRQSLDKVYHLATDPGCKVWVDCDVRGVESDGWGTVCVASVKLENAGAQKDVVVKACETLVANNPDLRAPAVQDMPPDNFVIYTQTRVNSEQRRFDEGHHPTSYDDALALTTKLAAVLAPLGFEDRSEKLRTFDPKPGVIAAGA